MLTSSSIQRAYLFTADDDVNEEALYSEEVDKLLAFSKMNKGNHLLIPLNLYLDNLRDYDLALIPYMDKEHKRAILRNTQVTYLFLLAQKKYENEQQKSENDERYEEYLKKCRHLIDAINYKKNCEQQDIEPAPDAGYHSEEQPVCYLGLYAGYFFAHQMQRCTSGSFTKNIIKPLSSFNQKRLYWVWSSGVVKIFLSILPPDFFFENQANQTISFPDPYLGGLSFGIYYFRFAINVFLIMKHTIPGPWMGKEELSIPWTERFLTQIQQRKFVLLNDFFWGTANALCFFLLYGKGALGSAGDMVTLALLGMDIALAVWNFEEERTQYNKDKQEYEKELIRLKTNLIMLQGIQIKNPQPHLKEQLSDLELQIETLDRAHQRNEEEWAFKQNELATNILYAVGLIMAFVLLTSPFFPLPAATLAAMTLSGAVLCFAFALIYNGVQGGMKLQKTRLNAKEDQQQYADKINEFKSLIATSEDEHAKKLLFLEIKKLAIKNENHEKTLTLQTLKLILSVLTESLIPPLIFLSLVFLPLGTALAVLGTAIGLSMTTQALMANLLQKETEELGSFDLYEVEYIAFCEDPDIWNKKESKTTPGFFPPQKSESKELQPSPQPGLDRH
jgi:hypothetical protein